MSNQNKQITLDDILDAFMASVERPDHAALTAWVQHYPQYAQELTEFAASWGLMETLPPVADNDAVSEETLVLRGMSIVQNILHDQRQTQAQVDTDEPIIGLIAVAKKRGMNATQLADHVELSIPLISKFDRRLFRPASVPPEAHTAIANALQLNVSTVARYLQQPPTFAPGALHHAGQAPRLAEQEDFFDAIRRDRSISEVRRRRWLALEPHDAR